MLRNLWCLWQIKNTFLGDTSSVTGRHSYHSFLTQFIALKLCVRIISAELSVMLVHTEHCCHHPAVNHQLASLHWHDNYTSHGELNANNFLIDEIFFFRSAASLPTWVVWWWRGQCWSQSRVSWHVVRLCSRVQASLDTVQNHSPDRRVTWSVTLEEITCLCVR